MLDMADTIKTAQKLQQLAKAITLVPFLPGIHEMPDEELKMHGYYRGFYCQHGHRIRHLDSHWCYECVRKIQNNNCGFDVNYLNKNYKSRMLELWNQIPVGDWDECWDVPWLGSRRMRFPSYTTGFNSRYNGNVTIHKIIYQCAWGDVGKLFVTRTCKNKKCLNPLHLISSFNRMFPPQTIHPFEPEFDPRKAMMQAQIVLSGADKSLVERQYKNTIQHPLANKNTPDYDETQELYYRSYVQEFGKSATKNSE